MCLEHISNGLHINRFPSTRRTGGNQRRSRGLSDNTLASLTMAWLRSQNQRVSHFAVEMALCCGYHLLEYTINSEMLTMTY